MRRRDFRKPFYLERFVIFNLLGLRAMFPSHFSLADSKAFVVHMKNPFSVQRFRSCSYVGKWSCFNKLATEGLAKGVVARCTRVEVSIASAGHTCLFDGPVTILVQLLPILQKNNALLGHVSFSEKRLFRAMLVFFRPIFWSKKIFRLQHTLCTQGCLFGWWWGWLASFLHNRCHSSSFADTKTSRNV